MGLVFRYSVHSRRISKYKNHLLYQSRLYITVKWYEPDNITYTQLSM